MKYNLSGQCYVLHQGFYNEILQQRHDFVYYPEQGLLLVDLVQGRTWEVSVITESPWIIAAYSQENVWVYRNGKWVNPQRETYACSVNIIMSEILLIKHSIPSNIISYQTSKELKDKIAKNYEK